MVIGRKADAADGLTLSSKIDADRQIASAREMQPRPNRRGRGAYNPIRNPLTPRTATSP